MKIIGKFSVIIQVLLISIIYISCTKKSDLEQYGQISGKVKDAVSGEPISGAVVTLNPINSSTTTSGDGAYRFIELQSRQYSIQVMKDGFQTNSTTVDVVAGENQVDDLLIIPAQPILNVSTTLLDYSSDKLLLPIEIRNEGAGQLTWNITANKTWISPDPTNGVTNANVSTVNISIDRNHLGKTTYTGAVVVSSNAGSATINVTVNVNGPLLNVTPIDLDFGADLTALPLEIRNIGNGTLNWNVVENIQWLSVNPISGSTMSEVDAVTISVDRSGLSQGTYSQSISIASDGGTETIPVNLVIANPNAPTVTCASALNISQTTAEVPGNITNIGSSNVTQRGHCWATSHNPTITDMITTLGPTSSPGEFASQLSGLMSNTTYYVRAYATNSNGTGYSTEQAFTTTSNSASPVVTTGSVTNINITDAIAGGSITDAGTGNITQHGHCWSTSQNPDINNSKTQLGIGTIGNFSSNLTQLSENTSYYVRAYATNGAGTGYGIQQIFTTMQSSLPILTTTNVSDITGNSAVSGGTISNNGGAFISDRGVCWSTDTNPTTSDSYSSSGSGSGSFISNLTGLSPITQYYVRAYATNSAGTAYGNEISFTTGHEIGEFYGGGIVFYVDDSGQHGLISSTSDQATSSAWGCVSIVISGADGTSIGTGLQNTNDIITGCSESGTAARICYDLVLNGYSDWYLPSKDELSLMYTNSNLIGGFNTGTSSYYWSSSEYNNSDLAWQVRFWNGSTIGCYKSGGAYRVRAIRSF